MVQGQLENMLLAPPGDLGDYERQHRTGPIAFWSSGVGPAFLPHDVFAQLEKRIATGQAVRGFDGSELSEAGHRTLARVNTELAAAATLSGGRDYAGGFITGNVGEVREGMVINGRAQNVLVVPQGVPRAERTAGSFAPIRMRDHPLSNNPQGVLAMMAHTMALAQHQEGFNHIYLREYGGGNGQTHCANAEDVMPSHYVGQVMQFAPIGPYELPRARKVVMEVPERIHEGDLALATVKHVARYLQRIAVWERARQEGAQWGVTDANFRGRGNALRVDNVYTNVVYVGKHPDREGWTVMAFPKPTEDNPFFNGMTTQTMYAMLEAVGAQYQIRPVLVEGVTGLAKALGVTHDYAIKGSALMEKLMLDHVEGVLAPGTYKGPQWVHGWVTEGRRFKEFEWAGPTRSAGDKVVELYNNACWALNGGVPLPDGGNLAANSSYCTMFDADAAKEGWIEQLDVKTIGNYEVTFGK